MIVNDFWGQAVVLLFLYIVGLHRDHIPESEWGTAVAECRSFACCAPKSFHSRPKVIKYPIPEIEREWEI